jgi:hypothetical protein
MIRRKQDAQRELFKAKDERKQLETLLQEKIIQMESYENLLNDYRYKKYEEETLETADDFFFTNKLVLRNAYNRFKDGVKKRLREQQLSSLFSTIYHQYLYKSI